MSDNRLMERRQNPQAGQSPMTTLQQLPVLVALERVPVPVLAIADDGVILFANTAFAQMLGYDREDVPSLRFHQIFVEASAADCALSTVDAFANLVVPLAHNDGSTVRALMSKSALQRSGDRLALATFQDLTEQLWLEES
jgi:PAS domain S-box-containing protein